MDMKTSVLSNAEIETLKVRLEQNCCVRNNLGSIFGFSCRPSTY
jgi:hypothetical protein